MSTIFPTIKLYHYPIYEGEFRTKGGLKDRIRLIDGDKYGKYAVAGKNLTEGEGLIERIVRFIKELFSSAITVVIKDQKLRLNKNSTIARLQISREELNKAIKEKTIDMFIQARITELEKDISKESEAFDSACIRGLRFNRVKFVGAHNAWIAKEGGWRLHNQTWSPVQQLEAGVRALELDIASDKKGNMFVAHGEVKRSRPQKKGELQTCEQALRWIKLWLNQNPNEVLLIKLDNKRDKHSSMQTIDDLLEKVELSPLLLTPEDIAEKGWPTVQKMIDDKKRLVIINSKQPKEGEEASKYTHFVGDTVDETKPNATEFVDFSEVKKKRGKGDGNKSPFKNIVREKGGWKAANGHNPRKAEDRLLLLQFGSPVPLPEGWGKKIPVPTVKKIRDLTEEYKAVDPHYRPAIIWADNIHIFITDGGMHYVNECNKSIPDLTI